MTILNRRAAVNVVATMLIFGIMISAVGVLYSQIAPTLLGYESTTTEANQEYIFQAIANEVERLSSAVPGSVGSVHVLSTQTVYDISTGRDLTIDILNNGVSELGGGLTIDIAEFNAYVNGSFQPRDRSLLNRAVSEEFYVVNGTGLDMFVLYSEFDYGEAQFTLYFRSQISVFKTGANSWKMTVMIFQIDFNDSPLDGSPLLFPVDLDEWTLRLRRQSSKSLFVSPPFVVNGAIRLSQDTNGVAGSTYNFPAIPNGNTLEISVVSIPILFGI